MLWYFSKVFISRWIIFYQYPPYNKIKKMYKTHENQMDTHRSQCLTQNCKKSAERNWINKEKIRTKASTNPQAEKKG